MHYRSTRAGKLMIGSLVVLSGVAAANVLGPDGRWGSVHSVVLVFEVFLVARALQAGVFVEDGQIEVRRLASSFTVPIEAVDHLTVEPKRFSDFELIVVTEDDRIKTGMRSANPAEEFVPNLPPSLAWRDGALAD